ncbi:MAG: hypothetical protein ACYDC9_06490 [Dermatophilaceae bacterium]
MMPIAVGLGIVGLLAGLAPSAAEPEGVFVGCGHALFGHPSPLPDPACTSAYAPFDSLSILALTVSALIVLLALGMMIRGSRAEKAAANARKQRPMPANFV